MTVNLPIELSVAGEAVRIPVRVLPRSSRTRIGGVRDGRLIVRVTAPPVDGAANQAVIEALADLLDLAPRALTVAIGVTGRNKSVDIRGLTVQDVRDRLLQACGDTA